MELTMSTRKRKSVKLTPEERKALRQFRKKSHTDIDAAEAIGISREVLYRVGVLGSGAPETIEKIRKAISVG